MIILIGLGNPPKKYAHTRHNAGRMLAAFLRRHPVEGLKAVETDCFMNDSGLWLKRWLDHRGLLIKNPDKVGTFDSVETSLLTENSIGLSPLGKNSIADTFGLSSQLGSRRGDLHPLPPGDNPGTPLAELRRQTAPSQSIIIVSHDDLDLALGSFKIHFGRGPRLHKGILSIEQALGTKDFWRVRIGVDNRKSQLKSAKISSNRIADKPDKSDSDSADLSIIRLSADAGRSKPTFSVSGEDYVLKPFNRDEKKILLDTFSRIRDEMVLCIQNNNRYLEDRR